MKPQRKRVRGGRRTPPRASKRQAFQDLVNVGVGGRHQRQPTILASFASVKARSEGKGVPRKPKLCDDSAALARAARAACAAKKVPPGPGADGRAGWDVDLTCHEDIKSADVDHTGGVQPPRSQRSGPGKRTTSEDPGEVVVPPRGAHTHTVVLLHGMYSPPGDCDMFKALPAYVNFLGTAGVKFVFPLAPRRNISWPTGTEPNVASWYNYFTRRDGHPDAHDVLDEARARRPFATSPTAPHR